MDYDFVFVEPVTTDSDIGFPVTPDENMERGQHERGSPFYGAEHERGLRAVGIQRAQGFKADGQGIFNVAEREADLSICHGSSYVFETNERAIGISLRYVDSYPFRLLIVQPFDDSHFYVTLFVRDVVGDVEADDVVDALLSIPVLQIR